MNYSKDHPSQIQISQRILHSVTLLTESLRHARERLLNSEKDIILSLNCNLSSDPPLTRGVMTS